MNLPLSQRIKSRRGSHPARWVLILLIVMGIYAMNPKPFENIVKWSVTYVFQVLADATGGDNMSPVKPGDSTYDPKPSHVPKGNNPRPIPLPDAKPLDGAPKSAVDPSAVDKAPVAKGDVKQPATSK